MIALSLAEVARAVGGVLVDTPDADARITGGVEFDSQRIGPGSLFVALPGERADGHSFAVGAIRAGAVGVLAARPVGVPAVVVADVRVALGALARAVLDRLPAVTVVGITGSSGKTSTKDLLAHLLVALGPTIAPAGSFNNEIGHPYTVLRAGLDTRYLVLELSARGRGHISELCAIAPPRIGVVLNVGSAHLGEFGSREAIAASKGELVEALPGAGLGGVAVLGADDPIVAAMAARTAARVLTAGTSDAADVAAADVRLDPAGRASYTLRAGGDAVPVRLGLHGAHHVGNSLAAAAVALELGLSPAAVAERLGTARAVSRWRMEVIERPDGVVVVNDAYNANPESMRAALNALTSMSAGRRTWAVLGEMAELGPEAGAEHEALGRLVMQLGVDRLVVVGERASGVHAGARRERTSGGKSVLVPDVDSAIALLRSELGGGDIVLVKASRAVGLERVAAALLTEAVSGA